MTPAWLVGNWFAWCLHAAALMAIGILAAQAFAWRHPQSRLRFFQCLLALSLMLPLLEPWRVRPVPAYTAGGVVSVRNSSTVIVNAPSASFAWEPLLLYALAGGAIVRLGLLCVGLLELRSLRRRGRAIQIDGLAGVEVREVDQIKGPAAFGWLAPVILLPRGLPDGPVRDAALRHELQHVIRQDWLENMLERAAASLLWFHPMAWWLMERIHLTREQAVDSEVAGSGDERDQYLQSLLISAGLANRPSLPAAGFVRRPRHLVERVAFLSKEAQMSIRDTAASAALATMLTAAALALANFYLPLQLSAQEDGNSPLHWTRPSPNVEGSVQLEATVNGQGEVIDARVVAGPDELRKRALQSVLFWNYTKDTAVRRVLPITIDFKKVDPVGGGVPGSGPAGLPSVVPPPPAFEEASFEGVDYVGLSTDLQQRAASAMASLHSGQRLKSAQVDQLRRMLAAIDPSLSLGVAMHSEGAGDRLRLQVDNRPSAPQQIRVGAMVQAANLVHSVEPVYPPLARQARIQGTVRFNIMVSKEGAVEQMTLVSGHPLLVSAAQDALRQFKYRPVMLNGKPIAVQTTVDVNFVL